jgi:hypothetical protein
MAIKVGCFSLINPFTLEIAGEDAVLKSYNYLKQLGAE